MTQNKTDPKQLEKKRWKVAVLANTLPFCIGVVFFWFGANVDFVYPLIYIVLVQLNIYFFKVERLALLNLIMLGSSVGSLLLNTFLYYIFISSDNLTPIIGILGAMICGVICIVVIVLSLLLYVILHLFVLERVGHFRKIKDIDYKYVPKQKRDE